mgnify:CR=1 FL=1
MLKSEVALRLAEGIALDLTEAFHAERRTKLSPDIDQLRRYYVVENGDYYDIRYRNGYNSGLPTTHCRMDKKTGQLLCLN